MEIIFFFYKFYFVLFQIFFGFQIIVEEGVAYIFKPTIFLTDMY